MIRFRATLLATFFLATGMPALAQQGVTPDTVTFAQVAALEGPASALGGGMRQGLLAAFEEANRAGGVHGRQIALTSTDDGYEPDRSAIAVRDVIAADNAIGFVGPVGTPTCQATQPIAAEAGMPFIGPFTGAGFLRDPALTTVFNVRASYGAETETWMKYLIDEQGLTKVAILYQDDGFGRAGLDGAKAALERRGLKLVAEQTYTRNTVAVKTALLAIRAAEPEAVVMVGAYKPVAEFVKLSRKLSFNPTFVTISFVGADSLAAELGPDGAGVIVSQVVPLPADTSIPLVAAYQSALSALDPAAKPGFVSLEGYIVGRLVVAALEKAGPDLTREGLLSALAAISNVDLGGITLHFGPGDNQGMDDVFLSRITPEGTYEPLTLTGSASG